MAATMRFTTFESVKDNVPHPYEGWDAFAELFELRVTENKHSVPLYCPSTFINERRLMENVLHVSFGVIDVDKHGEAAVMDALAYLTEERDLTVIFHTTHSHQAGLAEGFFKSRIILKFNRPVEMHEWDRVWYGMNDLSGGLADPQCKNPNAIYYFPSCPPGAEGTAIVEVLNPDGKALDVDELLKNAPKVEKKNSFIPEVDEEVLKRIDADTRAKLASTFLSAYPPAIEGEHGDAQTLKAAMVGGDFGLSDQEFWPILLSYNDRCEPPWPEEDLAKKLANAEKYRGLPIGWRLIQHGQGDPVKHRHLKKLAETESKKKSQRGTWARWLETALEVKGDKGQPIGPDPAAIFEGIAKLLGSDYPRADPVQLAMAMDKCIQATRTAGHRDITVDFVAHRIRQVQEDVQAKQAEAKAEQQLIHRSQIEDAFRSVGIQGRTSPYSKEEIKQFAKDAGFKSRAQFRRRWVIRYGQSFYFFVGGCYTRPYHESEAANAARENLLPANLELVRMGQNGQDVNISMADIVERYGTVANAVEIDLRAQHSSYSGMTKTLVEAPRHPLRMDIVPKFHPCVDRWLRSFTDDEDLTEDLLDWIACVPMIEEPICGLCIHGQPQVGKSMIADGLSRLWIKQGSATPLESISDNWNSILVEDGCPMMLADESIPKDFKGNPRTDYLRRIVQTRSQTLKRKRIPDATLKGCLRIVVAVNNLNKELVPQYAELTDADISAISERLLCIEVKKNNPKPKEALAAIRNDPRLCDAFFKGDMIAEHAAWLHQHREVVYGPRFLVQGRNNSELVMELMTSTGMRSEICHWLSRFITATNDIKTIKSAAKPVVDEGRDGRHRLLVTAEALHKLWNKYLPDQAKPSIGTIQRALGGVCEDQRVKKGNDWYRNVNLERVKYWAVTRGICNSEEAFDQHLARHGLWCKKLHLHDDDEE
jgi:hypothetical protein